jgi:DNA-binding MarR family transcriptional regulator
MTDKIAEKHIRSICELGRKFSDATVFMHEAIAQRVGLTGTDHKYLSLLLQNGAMTAGHLSKLTGLTTGAITGLVDRLERKNLVKREFNEDDRRKVIIVPNYNTATKLFGNTYSKLQNKFVNILSKLTENERQVIEKYLLSTIDVMNDITNNLKIPMD